MKQKFMGIIGCGNMGEAILAGWESKFKIVSEKDGNRRRYIQKKYKIEVFKDNKRVIQSADIIIIAVKPQDIDEVLNDIRNQTIIPLPFVPLRQAHPETRNQKLIISIAAGISTAYIERIIGQNPRVIRVMPNLAIKVKEGISCICKGRYAKLGDLLIAEKIFSKLGKTIILPERYLDIITAISGSGPGYIYFFLETIQNVAESLGLPKNITHNLVIQTAKGAIDLAISSKESLEFLRKCVTSKGGTTQAAIEFMERKNFDKIIESAIKRAFERAKELSKR